jgi:L-histidine N-alpha-methyltransferase
MAALPNPSSTPAQRKLRRNQPNVDYFDQIALILPLLKTLRVVQAAQRTLEGELRLRFNQAVTFSEDHAAGTRRRAMRHHGAHATDQRVTSKQFAFGQRPATPPPSPFGGGGPFASHAHSVRSTFRPCAGQRLSILMNAMNEFPQTAVDDLGAGASLLEEILSGLTSEKKALPSKLLYDATGSELFQRITELPEYYLTRTEKTLLGEHAADIVAAMPFEAGRGRALVEFGASDESKAISLLDVAGSHFSVYLAIDISPSVLGPIRTRMQATHPQIRVQTFAADFLQPLAMPGTFDETQAVGFLPGSTIGQFAPATVVRFLENVRRALMGVCPPVFVIGTDQCRDPRRVLPAYNDPAGISKAFNLNMLAHINRLTHGDLDQRTFGHEALWNPGEERVEIYLESRIEQSTRIGGRSIRFAAGESIQTGMSYKYGKERFLSIAAAAGWSPAGFWQDSEKLFGIHLLQA